MGQFQLDFNRPEFGCRELNLLEDKIRVYYSEKLESCSLFIMPVELDNPQSINFYDNICREISEKFYYEFQKINLSEAPWSSADINNISLHHLYFENVSPDSVKNNLYEIFRNYSDDFLHHRLNKFGLFIPRTGRINCYTFIHSGGYYRFRLARFKLKTIHPLLQNYLLSFPLSCPNMYFLNGPRASGYHLEMEVHLKHTGRHDLIKLSGEALGERKLKSAHEDVEKFFLESDPESIAAEVPVWLEPFETRQLLNYSSGGTLTGHIDLLRYEKNGMVGIWDYKPRAKFERKAHIQVYLYTLMMSQRTGIPLENFLCGYFDSEDAFYFYAKDVKI